MPSHRKENFFEGDTVSFVDRPFSVDEAHTHFSRLKRWGYNTIRYLFTWEALEHAGPGKYDEEYIEHTIKILRIAKEYGFYVFMDPHQDVWSRFTGGSGAPMWTVYACGLDPQKFYTTKASLVQNTWPNPEEFPKMIWATNYTRLSCQAIFTMFFAGKDFAPKCIIDGVNIQDYLQDHFVAACKHLAQRIHDAGDLEGEVVIGYESINEPNKGMLGHPNLNEVPEEQRLKKGSTPTAFQSMLTGSGRAVEVPTWDFGNLGPYKSGTELIDPKGETAWLDPNTWDDSKYGWKRAESWKLGEDIWAQHGVWDPSTDELKKPFYFTNHPTSGEKIDEQFYINNYFMDHYRRYKNAIRSVWPEAIMFIQPCPFEIPPKLKGTKDDDPNMVFASHFYDGITLITKKWNRYWNVDVLGVLRGRYASPALALKLGETAVRNCFRDQLSAIRQEGIDYMGEHPCLFTEIGIPYDMDDKKAYTTGNYFSQSLAVDANHYAVEASKANGMTWWLYSASNSHRYGDAWNGEDLSIYCAEDKQIPANPTASNTADLSAEQTLENDPHHPAQIGPGNLKKTLSVDSMSAPSSSAAIAAASDTAGYRAAEAFIRPYPIATHGAVTNNLFDLKNSLYTFALSSPSPTPQDHPTEFFLPNFHFPSQQTQVEVSGGKWTIGLRETEGVDGAEQQVLRWWHGEGEQSIRVRGVKRPRGAGALGTERDDDEGYLRQYLEMGRQCVVM
jgi:hypothetical protein